MFNDYFKKELTKFQKNGKLFAKENPLLAPALSEPSTDPDLERLMEGVAYLTAGIHQKIDDEFPEIIQSLLQIVSPQYIRPVPSITMMEFSPKGTISEALKIPAGTYLDATPVNGTTCRFRTCGDVNILPVKLTAAQLKEASADGISVDKIEVVLSFELNGLNIASLSVDKIRLFLADDYESASNLYHFLVTHLTEISVCGSDRSKPILLGKEQLQPVGFDGKEPLIPYPTNILPSFRILQEYFLFPQAFLFLDLSLKNCRELISGNRFEVSFVCSLPSANLPAVTDNSFKLYTVPAVNLFEIDADPVVLNQQRSDFILKPAEMELGTFQVFCVNSVYGLERGSDKKRKFKDFTSFSADDGHPLYHTVLRKSVKGRELACHMSIAYPPGMTISDREVASISVTCTNADLPSALRKGDIRLPTSNSPELVEFKNITTPTKSILPPLESNVLWRLLSHLSSNYLTYTDTDRLKTLLRHYIFAEGKDSPREIANTKRINGLIAIEAAPGEKIIERRLYRGQELTIQVKSDHFTGRGDMYLFGSILSFFLGTTASFNTYVTLTFEDLVRQETVQWPTRLGTRVLI